MHGAMRTRDDVAMAMLLSSPSFFMRMRMRIRRMHLIHLHHHTTTKTNDHKMLRLPNCHSAIHALCCVVWIACSFCGAFQDEPAFFIRPQPHHCHRRLSFKHTTVCGTAAVQALGANGLASIVASGSDCMREKTINNDSVVAVSAESAHSKLPLGRVALVPSDVTGIASDSFEHANTTSITVDYLSKEPPLLRAMEIGGVVVGELLAPLLASLVVSGIPDSWETFWAQSNGEFTNAQRATRALEELGPTFVKFGQALASRPDVIPKSLADGLSTLQDEMQPFDTEVAKDIIRAELNATLNAEALEAFVNSLTDEPIAAASVGEVFKGYLSSESGPVPVAVKVQRPGIRTVVERDAALLRSVATWIESLPSPTGGRLIATELVDAVEEFMSRVFEELDYRNEAANAATFASLYSCRGGSCDKVKVFVPEIMPELCTDHVLVMEWLDGTKLTSVTGTLDEKELKENIKLIETGIDCTLSQLLDTGVLHADPHAGNLMKTMTEEGPRLGYLDFGLLSTVPSRVRDGLVCAVAQLVFAKDVEAVAKLFGELSLLPQEVLLDSKERAALTKALEQTMAESLVYPNKTLDNDQTEIPQLKFDKLLDALARLVPRFRFQLPPYFINNARALSTLEGIARSLNPKFNVLTVMYPYCLNRLLLNPTKSPVVDATLQSLIRSPETGRVDRKRVSQLLSDSALLTGYRQRRVLWDILKTSEGRKLALQIALEETTHRLPFGKIRQPRPQTKSPIHGKRRNRFLQL